MRLAIVGDKLLSKQHLQSALQSDYINTETDDMATAITTGEDGIGAIAHAVYTARVRPTIVFRPDWTKHGKRAKYVRNQRIADTADKLMIYTSLNLVDAMDEWADLINRFSKQGKSIRFYRLDDEGRFPTIEEVPNE